MTEIFVLQKETYQDQQRRDVHVMVLSNRETGELAEVLLNTPGGQNRSTGAGAVNGLLLMDPRTNELREVLPYRRGFAGGVMAPFANRIREGTYTLSGIRHQLACNWDEIGTRMTRDGRHAIHGLLPKELELTSQETSETHASMMLTAKFDGTDEGYPFLVQVDFTYRLDADGLSIAVTATNLSTQGRPAPFMIGWHPYIQLQGSVDRVVVEFDSRSDFVMSEPTGPGPEGPDRDTHPTGRFVPCADFSHGRPLGDQYWDDGFKALASVQSVPRLETRIVDDVKGGAAILLWQGPQCRFIQVYTGMRDLGVVAVEPMSGQTDCFNNGDGLVVLQAGETWETAFGVRFDL